MILRFGRQRAFFCGYLLMIKTRVRLTDNLEERISLYILGLFLGIDLIFAGAGWIGVGLGLRQTA
jgi:uncharacterized membrane protein HdeD (DUF308 family)